MEKIVYAVIVLYNVDIANTETYQSLNQQTNKKFEILFVDNSTSTNQNENYAKQNQLEYISMNGNKGISIAYNKAIDFLRTKADYLIWLDDDTTLPPEFIETVKQTIEKDGGDILLPIVTSHQKIISPTKPKEWKKHFKSSEEIKHALPNVTAINSGMCVKMSCYEKYYYDERIFLDYIDHVFMEHVRNTNLAIRILPVNLIQSFSLDTKGDESSAKHRLNIFMKDVRVAYETKKIKALFIRLKYGIRVSLTQKDLRFFFKAITGRDFK